jgi:hypothetical protein
LSLGIPPVEMQPSITLTRSTMVFQSLFSHRKLLKRKRAIFENVLSC